MTRSLDTVISDSGGKLPAGLDSDRFKEPISKQAIAHGTAASVDEAGIKASFRSEGKSPTASQSS
jgi:hypothetical protein